MDSPIVLIIITALSSGAVTYLLAVFFGKRKDQADISKITAETTKIEGENQRAETIYYRERVEETIGQMKVLGAEVKRLKEIIEQTQSKYEQRLGALHNKIDTLTHALERANTALTIANKTIAELRQEVKNGNIIITELRKEITHLLVKEAEDNK